MLLVDKVSLLNLAALESLNAADERIILKKITDAGIAITNADFAYAWVKDKDNMKFRLVYRSPQMPYVPEYPRKNGMTAKAIRTKIPQYAVNVASDKRVKADAKQYMRSAVVIPITHRNKTHGIIVLCFKNLHKFLKEEQTLCSSLGNSAAQAITINRLHFDLKDFKHTLDNTLDSIFIFDPETFNISYINRGVVQQLNLTRKKLINESFLSLLHPSSRISFKQKAARVVRSKVHSSVFEINFRSPTGKRVPAEIMLQYVATPGQPAHLLGIVRDLTERKKSEEKIKQAAFHDALTGLPNRILFTDQLTNLSQEAERENKKFAVMFLDLDRFKFINDILGHVMGDELLKKAAERLKKSIKKQDFVSRLGGDEFVILLRDLKSPKDAERVAQRIVSAFQLPFKLGGQEIYVTSSVGISLYPHDGRDAVRLLKNADNALYRVKQDGGNGFQHYHQGIVIPQMYRLELEKQLRQAVAKNELMLFYQPIYNLKTGTLVSAEALVRWKHPQMGLILPGEFITQAEESGLIVPMGLWIIEEACKQAKLWSLRGRDIPISINISPRQLLQQDLFSHVRRLLKKYDLPSYLIELELTETSLIKNMDMSIEVLKQFRALGLKVFIDDFGTGYASLSYLKRLPIDFIKIDQSFVQGAIGNPQDANLIKAIISMAHHLKLKVVAEGVESGVQARFLASAKCDLVQGNYYSSPLAEEQFDALFKLAGF